METEIQLQSGHCIPMIGFGPGIMGYSAKMQKNRSGISSYAWRAYMKFWGRKKDRIKFVNAISNAFNNGFRLLDYSNAYGNQELISKAIKLSNVNRSELFLTSRISNPAQFKSRVREEFLDTLSKWNVESVDLLQFHWPVTDKYVDTWKEMIRLKEEGYVKILGVANCHAHHIEELEKKTGIIPEINQVEVHPLFTQKPLIEYCKSKGIVVEAYTPVARYDDRLVRLPLLKRLERKYHKTFVQIILRWHIQNGVIPVVRALSDKHQKENIDIFDFEIDSADVKLIDSLNLDSRLRYNPDNCDFSIL